MLSLPGIQQLLERNRGPYTHQSGLDAVLGTWLGWAQDSEQWVASFLMEGG